MKQTLITLFLIFGIFAGTFINSPPAQADRPFTGDTIKGSYYFLVSETRNEDGVIKHCEAHGVANIFDDGRMEICGPTMCNGLPGAPEPGFFDYVITGDEILITEVGETDSTHCKILDNGRLMLCDGGQRTLPELWTWAGTIVKMKNTTNPDLLTSEGCLTPSE